MRKNSSSSLKTKRSKNSSSHSSHEIEANREIQKAEVKYLGFKKRFPTNLLPLTYTLGILKAVRAAT